MKLDFRSYRVLALAVLALFEVSPARAEETRNVNMASTYEITASPVSPSAIPAGSPVEAVDPASKPAGSPAGNQPPSGARTSGFLVTPGDPVVGPGTAPAPVYRVQNPLPAPTRAASGFPMLAVLMALLGATPAALWVAWNRRNPGRRVRKAAAATAIPTNAVKTVASGPRRPTIPDAELSSLREEVMGGLKEMRTRTEAFTDALETGLAELQTELARARRTVVLLREERLQIESRLERGRGAADGVIDLFDIGAESSTGTPIRRKPEPQIFVDADPNLDPAWQLLDDPAPGIVTARPQRPAAQTAPAPAASPAPQTAPLGAAALRSFTARPIEPAAANDFRRALDFTTPAERREMILSLASAGRSIDDIARQVKVGRGEVTLALTRARNHTSRVS